MRGDTKRVEIQSKKAQSRSSAIIAAPPSWMQQLRLQQTPCTAANCRLPTAVAPCCTAAACVVADHDDAGRVDPWNLIIYKFFSWMLNWWKYLQCHPVLVFLVCVSIFTRIAHESITIFVALHAHRAVLTAICSEVSSSPPMKCPHTNTYGNLPAPVRFCRSMCSCRCHSSSPASSEGI